MYLVVNITKKPLKYLHLHLVTVSLIAQCSERPIQRQYSFILDQSTHKHKSCLNHPSFIYTSCPKQTLAPKLQPCFPYPYLKGLLACFAKIHS